MTHREQDTYVAPISPEDPEATRILAQLCSTNKGQRIFQYIHTLTEKFSLLRVVLNSAGDTISHEEAVRMARGIVAAATGTKDP